MIVRTCVFLLLSATLLAQEGPFGPPVPKGEVPPRNVSFERIRDANKEPQNWLTYSGGLSSQRHSLLTTIRPANARDLELKWVFQSRSLERHQVTPLVVDGTMYTIQSPNDVIALNAATGKQIWVYPHTPDPAAKNCLGGRLHQQRESAPALHLPSLATTRQRLRAPRILGQRVEELLDAGPRLRSRPELFRQS